VRQTKPSWPAQTLKSAGLVLPLSAAIRSRLPQFAKPLANGNGPGDGVDGLLVGRDVDMLKLGPYKANHRPTTSALARPRAPGTEAALPRRTVSGHLRRGVGRALG
jgi:hypothetical protein